MVQSQNPSHPGEVLRILYLEALGLSQTQLAKHLGCTRVSVNEILNGRRGISPGMACKLADALGTTEEVWLNLQTAYDLHQAKKKHTKIPRLKAS